MASICALLKPYERERNSCLSAAEAQKFMVGDESHIRPASVLDKTDEQRRSQSRRWIQGLTGRFLPMDRETILRELAQIEDRVARTQRQIASYREHISRIEDRGRDAQWAKLMLRQSEEVLALHLSMHEKLIERLSRSTK